MADEGGLENKVNAQAPNAGGGIFDSIGSALEDLVGAVRAIPKVVSKAAYYTYYTAKAAAGMAAGVAMADPSALIMPVGIAGGVLINNKLHKKKTTYKQFANELAIGGLLGGLMHHLFKGVSYIGEITRKAYGTIASLFARGAASFATMPVFLGTHEYLNRFLISDYKPQPLEMGKRMKSMWPIIPAVVANFSVVPEYLGHNYQMPVAAGISTVYGAIKGEKKEEKKEAAAPQQPDMNQLMQQYQNQQRRAA